jgi:hypothetical protein
MVFFLRFVEFFSKVYNPAGVSSESYILRKGKMACFFDLCLRALVEFFFPR